MFYSRRKDSKFFFIHQIFLQKSDEDTILFPREVAIVSSGRSNYFLGT